jgi:drug/metabolite transporter (DMT)-like permease
MNWKEGLRQSGVLAALGAAVLFGAGTPLAKLLLNSVSPWLLAGLLYLGSGLGLTLYRLLSRAPSGWCYWAGIADAGADGNARIGRITAA